MPRVLTWPEAQHVRRVVRIRKYMYAEEGLQSSHSVLNSPKLSKMFLSGNATKRWCSSSCYCIFRRYRWYVLRVPNDIHLTIAEFASPGVSEA